MSAPDKIARISLKPVRLRTAATIFVCAECPRGKHRRKELKAAVKADGRKRDVRVVACGCLDICPKRGTAAVVASAGGAVRCTVIPDGATPMEFALPALLDDRVANPVSNELRNGR